MEDNEEIRQQQQVNYADANALQIRLNPEILLEKMRRYLTATEIRNHIMEDGGYKQSVIQIGTPRCNNEGYNYIMQRLEAVINPQTVQGNFPIDGKNNYSSQYEQYIYEFHTSVATELLQNMYKYGIDESELDGILNTMMSIIIPYMSRLIGNKERDSYAGTIRSIENNSVRDRGGWKIFGK